MNVALLAPVAALLFAAADPAPPQLLRQHRSLLRQPQQHPSLRHPWHHRQHQSLLRQPRQHPSLRHP